MAKDVFKLERVGPAVPRVAEAGNLIEQYEGSGTQWIATLHWRAFGFSRDERVLVKEYIQQAIQRRPAT